MCKRNDINRIQFSIFKKAVSGTIIFLFLSLSLFCQNQKLADSLESIFISGDFSEENRLQFLEKLAVQHPDLKAKLQYSDELLSIAKAMDSINYFFTAYLEKGNALHALGEMPEAIDNFLEAGNMAIKYGDSIQLAVAYGSVANVYVDMENIKTGIFYYKKSIDIIKNNLLEKKDTIKLATSIENLGVTYLSLNKPDSAFIYLSESGELFSLVNHEIGMAYNEGNKGLTYAQLKDYTNAELSINHALDIIEKFGHFDSMCQFLLEISEIYLIKNEFKRAYESAFKSLELAKEHNLKYEISPANLQLSRIYELEGNDKQSLAHYKNHIMYRDSVIDLSSIQKIANLRTDFEVAQKQTEVDLKQSEVELLNQQKSNLRILAFSMIALLGLTGLYFRNIRKAKRRSDDLLLNILPAEIAEELKIKGEADARDFDLASILFTDFFFQK